VALWISADTVPPRQSIHSKYWGAHKITRLRHCVAPSLLSVGTAFCTSGVCQPSRMGKEATPSALPCRKGKRGANKASVARRGQITGACSATLPFRRCINNGLVPTFLILERLSQTIADIQRKLKRLRSTSARFKDGRAHCRNRHFSQ
jgi:hypothetical protein